MPSVNVTDESVVRLKGEVIPYFIRSSVTEIAAGEPLKTFTWRLPRGGMLQPTACEHVWSPFVVMNVIGGML